MENTAKKNTTINGEWVATITFNDDDAIYLRDNKKKQLINDILTNHHNPHGEFDMKVWKVQENGVDLEDRILVDFFDLDREEQHKILEVYLYLRYVGGSFKNYHLAAA